MKILYHYRTRSKDGTTIHIDGLVAALRRHGHEVIVMGPPAMDTTQLGADGAAVSALKRLLPRAIYELLELGYNAPAFWRLRRTYLAHRPDVMYERYALPLLAGVWLKRLYGIPLLLEVNSPLFEERSAFGGLALRRLMHAVERMVWHSADVVLPVTRVLAEKLCACGVDKDRVMVVPNGVGPEFLCTRLDGMAVRRRYRLEARIVLGFTGFVRDWHGLDVAIDVIGTAPRSLGLHLLVAGDGPAREGLEQHARNLGVADRITFAGIVPRDEMTSFVAAFDIALQPRAIGYASPLKIFEYMAAGRAIVAPDLPNIWEILEHDKTAVLVDPIHATAFHAAIERLARDPALRLRLGGAARDELLRRGFTWDANASRVTSLCRALHGCAGSPERGASEPLDPASDSPS